MDYSVRIFIFFLACRVGRAGEWPRWGNHLNNDRYASEETEISLNSLRHLVLKWSFPAFGSVSANPTMIDDFVYTTDWGGGVHSINKESGQNIWSRRVYEFTDLEHDYSRSSPLIIDNMIIIASNLTPTLLAINRQTGDLLWRTVLVDINCSRITMSPVSAGGRIYVGISNGSKGSRICPGARGAVVAVDSTTGHIEWTWYTIPDHWVEGSPKDQITGATVWGMTFAFDLNRNTVYVPTGNIYTMPQEIYDCEKKRAPRDPSCLPEDVVTDSIAALNMTNGEMFWFTSLIDYDAWTIACQSDYGEGCPDPEGPDADFAQGPIVMDIEVDQRLTHAIGAGQKNGIYWMLDRISGDVIWKTRVGPPGVVGGLEFGSAYDGDRVYVASANSDRNIFYLRLSRGVWIDGSHWAALDPDTGNILWETPAPITDVESRAMAAVTVANGLVFVGTTDDDGHMYILDARDGSIEWTYQCGAPVGGGPTIVDGLVFWGCGYKSDTSPRDSLLVFHVDDSS